MAERVTKYSVILVGVTIFMLVVAANTVGLITKAEGLRGNATVETDTLRLAQTMEIMDQRPDETMMIRFEEEYDEIEVSDNQVRLSGSEEQQYNIYVGRSVDGGTMSGDTVCIANEISQITVAETC